MILILCSLVELDPLLWGNRHSIERSRSYGLADTICGLIPSAISNANFKMLEASRGFEGANKFNDNMYAWLVHFCRLFLYIVTFIYQALMFLKNLFGIQHLKSAK